MKKKSILICGLITTLLFSGCGSAGSGAYDGMSASKNNFAAGFDAKYEGADIVESEDYDLPQDEANNSQEEKDNKQIKTADSSKATLQEKLVYTCDLTIQTLKYDETIKAINEKIKEYNGIIEQQTESDNSYNWYYSDYVKREGTLNNYIKVRIPTEKYNDFLSSIEGNGKVINKSQNVENISKTYYETEAIIESLKIQEERLLEMLKSADKIEDMITVEARLTEVQTELNKQKTLLSSMDMDVDYSTINLNIEEVLEYSQSEPGQKTNTFIDRLKNTIVDSWKSFLNALEELLFLVIRLVPALIIGLIILVPIYKVLKKKGKLKIKKPKKQEEPKDKE